MKHMLIATGGLILLTVVLVAAQPPSGPVAPPPLPGTTPPPAVVIPTAPGEPKPPIPPLPLPASAVPAAPAPPAAAPETPLSKFQPLNAFPALTQEAVRGALIGADWMAARHQPNGRFLYGYLPALRQPMARDHDLAQARAALALAQAAKFSGDNKLAVLANQTILTLLAGTRPDPTDPSCRVPLQVSFVCNRVGYAALIVLAVCELPSPTDKLIEEAEQLCAFLRKQLRADGSVHYTDGPTDVPTQIDPAGVNEYPGLTLHALAASNRLRPAEWKKDAVKRGVAHYSALFRTKPHPMLAATVVPAAAELFIQTKLPEMAPAAFEMCDWLCALQIGANDPKFPQWAGGFRSVVNGQMTDAPPTAIETGLYVQALACGYQLTRLTPDLTREAKYRPALAAAVQFLCGMQFAEVNTRHFENSFRATMLIGAFHWSPADGNLRIDVTACSLSGLLRFLSSGAER